MVKFLNKQTGVTVEWNEGKATFFDKQENRLIGIRCPLQLLERDSAYEKVKERLFITEDGVDVVAGQSVAWVISGKFAYMLPFGESHIRLLETYGNIYKVFSTQLSAEDWILNNIVNYTKEQILYAVNHWSMTDVSWEQVQDYVENRS